MNPVDAYLFKSPDSPCSVSEAIIDLVSPYDPLISGVFSQAHPFYLRICRAHTHRFNPRVKTCLAQLCVSPA